MSAAPDLVRLATAWLTQKGAAPPRPDVALSFSIAKTTRLDDGRILIEGTATDESVDQQGDVVTFEASRRAFAAAGDGLPLRQAHDATKPVGRVVDWRPNERDRSIEVRAFVSAGAPDAQALVRDGVLRAFSVAGDLIKSTYEVVAGRRVRKIVDWVVREISLVDVPANPHATFALAKLAAPVPGDDLVGHIAAEVVRLLEGRPDLAEIARNEEQKLKRAADLRRLDERIAEAERRVNSMTPQEAVKHAPLLETLSSLHWERALARAGEL